MSTSDTVPTKFQSCLDAVQGSPPFCPLKMDTLASRHLFLGFSPHSPRAMENCTWCGSGTGAEVTGRQ